MHIKSVFKLQKGQTLIELLITIGLAAILLPALLTGFVATRSGRAQQDQRLQATAYLRETQEAVRAIRENSWDVFALSSSGLIPPASPFPTPTYIPKLYYPLLITPNPSPYPTNNAAYWSLPTPNPSLIPTPNSNGLTRQIVINDVCRDLTTGNILPNAYPCTGPDPYNDPSTKKVTITVTSSGVLNPITLTSIEYLTRNTNQSIAWPTASGYTFSTGTIPASIQINGGGEVILGPGLANGDWCNPVLNIGGLNVSGTSTSNDAIWAKSTGGKVLIGTGGSSAGVSLSNIAISDTTPPANPVASLVGTFNGNTTNDVFSDGNYAYLATSTTSKEVQVVDLTKISGGKYSEIGSFNPSVNGTGNSVFVLGNIGYVTVHSSSQDTLYTFDLSTISTCTSSKPCSLKQLGSVKIAGTGTKVYVVGNYAYVSIAGATQELQIIQVSSDGKTLTVVGQADVNGGAANSVYVNSAGTRAYLATGASSSLPEFFIINVSTKTGNRGNIGTYDAVGMDPHQVTIVPPPGNRAILVGTGGTEYQVIDISNEASPKNCVNNAAKGLDISSGINGVATVAEADGDVFSYIYTRDSSQELKIIRGGPGGTNGLYTSTGTYTSKTLDTGHDVAFNGFTVTETKPANTNIQYKIAIKHGISGSCGTVTFVDSDYQTFSPGALSFGTIGTGYNNPGQCLRYQAILSTTDTNQTPVLKSIKFNYSP